MRGIAEGAGVALDKVWAANLIPELESLMGVDKYDDPPSEDSAHCSDIYARQGSDGGDGEGERGPIAHGLHEELGEPLCTARRSKGASL